MFWESKTSLNEKEGSGVLLLLYKYTLQDSENNVPWIVSLYLGHVLTLDHSVESRKKKIIDRKLKRFRRRLWGSRSVPLVVQHLRS